MTPRKASGGHATTASAGATARRSAKTPPTRRATTTPQPSPAPPTTPDTPPAAASVPATTEPRKPSRPSKTQPAHPVDAATTNTPQARSSERTTGVSRILYLPDHLLPKIRFHCALQGITRTQMALQALEATHADLAALVAADLTPQVVSGSLFQQVIPPVVSAHRQVEIKPTPAQLAIIDQLQVACGARDRSHLFAVALAIYLSEVEG